MVSVTVLIAAATGCPLGTGMAAVLAQPAWFVALQVAGLITVSEPAVPAPKLATYRVRFWLLIAAVSGPVPALTVGGVFAQPAGWRAVQARVLIIETVRPVPVGPLSVT